MACKKKPVKMILLFSSLMIIGLVVSGGCKESEPESPSGTVPDVKDVTPVAIEQTTCPIMGAAINKDIFVEYKGKKVYFCCPGCEDKFNEEPEKFLAKLPQFKN